MGSVDGDNSEVTKLKEDLALLQQKGTIIFVSYLQSVDFLK